ncbi:MAG: hypothetical protein DCF31_10600 [Alphaproteobacteria bacterium]|nr:MAG: hypothetical protein DCF31_10600 [Alphaproteobacteria bacterium]
MRTLDRLLLGLLMTGCSPDDPAPDRTATSAAEPVAAAPVVDKPAPIPATPRLLAPADPAGSVVDFGSLQGRWQVVGVALADGPVQAYVDDDPAYMGQVMAVKDKTLAWEAPRSPTTATLGDVCTGAATMRLADTAAGNAVAGLEGGLRQVGVGRPQPHEVACLDGGSWGGSDGGVLLFPIDDRTLAMRWYDNVILKLRWQAS